jgi:RimJ/RimL family protein N-acetyltransferase
MRSLPPIRLLAVNAPLVAAVREQPESLESRYGVELGPCRSLIESTLARFVATPDYDHPVWGHWLVVDDQSGWIVGACGFKAPPLRRTVEVTCVTFPPFERRGFGRATLQALVTMARNTGEVARLIAVTSPRGKQAIDVLRNAGFRQMGEMYDDEDSCVWRWEYLLA